LGTCEKEVTIDYHHGSALKLWIRVATVNTTVF